MIFKDIFPHKYFDTKIENMPVYGISRDTRAFSKGDIFFIIEGRSFDIFSSIGNIKDKAAAFVADKSKKELVKSIIKDKPLVFVSDVNKELKRCASILYPLDMSSFKIIGVTGTNGKTTVTYLIRYLLNRFGIKTALIGTINYFLGNESLKATHTTPDYLSLRKLLFAAQKKNIEYVIMEVSSHSIEQKRIEGITFNQCIFTNISRDHLDYHLTMNDYFFAKEKLFLNNPSACSIINTDDGYGRKVFLELEGTKYSYGFDDGAYYRIVNYELAKSNLKFTFNVKNGYSLVVKSRLIGRHNIYNILSALASVDRLGFSIAESAAFISSFGGPDGRLEEVANNIFVDYAHTPDALDNALCALRDSGYNNIILVFGCGGDRDKGKRKEMGRIASELAVFSVITSDNPRSEKANDICHDIEKGFGKNNYKIIVDRKRAIEEAIKLKNDYEECVLLVAGKGHEEYQITGHKKLPFKDKKVIEDIIDSA